MYRSTSEHVRALAASGKSKEEIAALLRVSKKTIRHAVSGGPFRSKDRNHQLCPTCRRRVTLPCVLCAATQPAAERQAVCS